MIEAIRENFFVAVVTILLIVGAVYGMFFMDRGKGGGGRGGGGGNSQGGQ
jgi:preprotein translocase subunit SecG